MNQIKLRSHQASTLNRMSYHKKGQVIVPTGGGKTMCMIEDVKREIKQDLMDTFIVYGSPKCYVDGIEIKGEGFVMTTKYGIIKLVDRKEFAYANFNNGRFRKS